ncbi:MAG: metallophosphoesterase [Promethearchaeota archaeon]
MKRKLLGFGLMGLIVFTPVLPFIIVSQLQKASYGGISGPWTLFSPANDQEIYILWETSDPCPTKMSYGTSADNLSYIYNDDTLRTHHQVILSNLLPNTHYYFQINYLQSDQTHQTQISHFISKPNSTSSEFTFLAISDTQQFAGNGYHPRIAQAVASRYESAKFLLTVGDLVGDGRNTDNWRDYFQIAAPYLNSMVLAPVIGNHDGNLEDVVPSQYPAEFHNYFPISQHDFFFLYSFNYSMVHFTICDLQYASAHELNATQLAWIEQDLQAAQSMPIRIVAFHCPVMSSGYYGNNLLLQTQLKPLLEKYNVQLVLNGHDHHYERLLSENVTYVVLGCGGTLQDPFDILRPESQAIAFGPSFTQITCNTSHIILQTLSLNGDLIDHHYIPAGETA